MKRYELTGGARIGMANATYPFAKLKVTENKLELNVSMIGKFVFSPKDVISIEPYQQLPIIGRGLKINHRVANYKGKIIFWTFKNPKKVIDEIRKTGFSSNMNSSISRDDEEIIAKQKQGDSPLKRSFKIGAIILWNLLLLTDVVRFYNSTNPMDTPSLNGMKIAVGLLFLTALVTLFSESFRRLILKEGRDLDDIKSILYLIIVVSSFMLVIFMTITNMN